MEIITEPPYLLEVILGQGDHVILEEFFFYMVLLPSRYTESYSIIATGFAQSDACNIS